MDQPSFDPGRAPSWRWKQDCIYCKEPARGNKQHVFPKHVGYRLKIGMTCIQCNNALGKDVDGMWGEDYWVQLLEGKTQPDPVKRDRFVFRHTNTGSQMVFPYTDPRAFRAAAKIAFELFSWFIRDHIFHPTFDTWRGYIRNGDPDLAATCQIFRTAKHPGRWDRSHELIVRPKSDPARGTRLDLRLFRSYEFDLELDWPYPWGDEAFDLGVSMDNPNAAIRVWRGHKCAGEFTKRIA